MWMNSYEDLAELYIGYLAGLCTGVLYSSGPVYLMT